MKNKAKITKYLFPVAGYETRFSPAIKAMEYLKNNDSDIFEEYINV